MRKWTMVVLVAACGKSEGPQRKPVADEGSAVPVVADAAAGPAPHEMPAKGVANSAIESAPRKDWPCRFVQTLDGLDEKGTHIATTWEYGKRTHCWLPADIVGSRGIVGCPDKQVEKNLENKVEMAETYSYDSDDHLIAVKTMATTFEYAWDGNLVRGIQVRGEVRPYVAADYGVEVKEGEDSVRIEIDPAGHVVKYQQIDSLGIEPTVFTWKGSRLAKLQEIGSTKIEYDCKSPPKG